MRRLLTLCALLLAACPVDELVTLDLTLTDFASGEPQAGAAVGLFGGLADEAVETDAEGRASLPVPASAFYELSVAARPVSEYQALLLPGVAGEEDFEVAGVTLDRGAVALNVESAGDDPCAQPPAPIAIDPLRSIVIVSVLDVDGETVGPAAGARVSIDVPHATPIVDLVSEEGDDFTFCDETFCEDVCGQTTVTVRADSNGAINFLSVPPDAAGFEVALTPPAGRECVLVPGDAPLEDLFFDLVADTWTWITFHCRS